MPPNLTIACVFVGDGYTPDYVTNLKSMVERHLSTPHQFVCITDQPHLFPDIHTLPDQTGEEGWWAKLGLFHPNSGLEGRVLYLDLDVVITGGLTTLLHPEGFWICEDWLTDGYNSSVMLFDAGAHTYLWEEFDWRTKGMFPGDQDYLTKKLTNAQLFNMSKIVSYKHNGCRFGPAVSASIVVFHGHPKPHEVEGWVEKTWK